MAEREPVHVEDVVSVGSRVSWAAVFAGAFVALAIYLVLALLGAALGLSVRHSVRANTLATGAAVWAILSLVVALLVGGWTATQVTVGENKGEAVLHGLLVWGVMFLGMLIGLATGVRTGFNAVLGMANTVATASQGRSEEDWTVAAQRAGVPPAQIEDWRAKAKATAEAANDPQAREQAAESAKHAAWWSLLGTVVSIAAAIGGGLLGCGPSFRLVPVRPGQRVMMPAQPPLTQV
jgi:hypothetical protein